MSNQAPSDFVARVTAAAAAVRTVLQPTPLQFNAFLSDRHGANIYLKREDLTPVRSYKLRGALIFSAKQSLRLARTRRLPARPRASMRKALPTRVSTSGCQVPCSCR